MIEAKIDMAQLVEPLGPESVSAESCVMGPDVEETSKTLVSPVEHIFQQIFNRRAGIVKALTTEFAKFYQACDPDKDNLCLYGLASGKWVVGLPEAMVPAEFPEPIVGINFARDGMPVDDWLKFVAIHSDSWLLGLAAFYSALHQSSERKRLFCMLSDVPTVYDVVIGKADPSASTYTPSLRGSNDSKYACDIGCSRRKLRSDSGTCEELAITVESRSNEVDTETLNLVDQLDGRNMHVADS